MAQAEAGHFLADFSADPCLNQVMRDGNAARQSPSYGRARQACLASLVMEQVLPLARRRIPGTQESRPGCAEIYAVNLENLSFSL